MIESSDPYQVGWRAARIGERQRIPVVAFYHSHFTQAYLRGPAARLGKRGAALAMRAAEAYTRALYNRFEATLVPSAKLADVLRSWGVMNTQPMPLGVNTEVFRPGRTMRSKRGRGSGFHRRAKSAALCRPARAGEKHAHTFRGLRVTRATFARRTSTSWSSAMVRSARVCKN